MAITENSSLWLNTGIAGENQARALQLPISFTRVMVGDANGVYPGMDTELTALVNEVMAGEINSHKIDPDDANQRIVEMSIPPTGNFDALELLLYAKYGETEFPHTYFRLAAPYPIRPVQSGGSQVKLKYTIRVSQYTDVNIQISPNLAYVTQEQLADSNKPLFVTGTIDAQTNDNNRLHTFTAPGVDIQIPEGEGEAFRIGVGDSVDLEAGKCRLLAPQGKKMLVVSKEKDAANFTQKGVIYQVLKVNGVWEI